MKDYFGTSVKNKLQGAKEDAGRPAGKLFLSSGMGDDDEVVRIEKTTDWI